MDGHPEGLSGRLLELSGLAPCRALDMGAGAGGTVRLLRSLGFEAVGVDIAPRGEGVVFGNINALPFEDASFDAVFSECALETSGCREAALREAHRVLKTGGALLVSDVFWGDPRAGFTGAGFSIRHFEDRTEDWISFILERVWRGEELPACGKKCGYYIIICERES